MKNKLGEKMSDTELTVYLHERMKEYDAHLKEWADKYHSKIDILDNSLGFLVKVVEEYKQSSFSIKSSLIGVVFAIIVQVGGFLYLWGMQTQTVSGHEHRIEYLETIHPRSGAMMVNAK